MAESYWESDKNNPSNKILRYKKKENLDKSSDGQTNDVKKGGLLKKWMGTMTDDSGAFQGGMKKRLFGRAQDFGEERFGGTKEFKNLPGSDAANVSKKDQREYSEDIREAGSLNKKAGHDMYDINRRFNKDFKNRVEVGQDGNPIEIPAYSEEFSYAREFALDFDPSNKDSVAELQRRLNNAGYGGKDGNPLVVDGQLGDNTMSGLRAMQNDMIYENRAAKNIVKAKVKENSQKNAIDNVSRWIKKDQARIQKSLRLEKIKPYRDLSSDEQVAREEETQTSEELKTLRGREDEWEASRQDTTKPKFKTDKPVWNPTTQVWESNKDMPNMPTKPVVPMPDGYEPSKQAVARYEAQLNREEENPVSQVRSAIKDDKPAVHETVSAINNEKYYPEIADELNNANTMEEYKKILHEHTTKDAGNWDEEIKETDATQGAYNIKSDISEQDPTLYEQMLGEPPEKTDWDNFDATGEGTKNTAHSNIDSAINEATDFDKKKEWYLNDRKEKIASGDYIEAGDGTLLYVGTKKNKALENKIQRSRYLKYGK